ncbi:phage protein Gp37 [Candidatus Magnetomonas plexicatena]|uniref:phage protein Gp37 n=1 Tax=Candidatus Magnetomonas plexicatena TaxID=2552947 RepID=UPI001C776803|nr:DUF1834 family protein [Nitrospirales bacterium LBB_01]
MLKIEEMETLITDTLNQVTGLTTVDIHVGNIEDALTGSMKLPAALVVYKGAKANLQTEGGLELLYNVDFSFTVFVIAKGVSDPRRNGKKDTKVGVKTLLEDIRGILNGLQQDSATLIWEEESLEVMTKTGIAVYSQHYRCREALTAKRGQRPTA